MRPLDLARGWQALLDQGVVSNRADLARKFGCSRARVTQVLDLLNLHPAIVAFVEGSGEGATERALRPLAGMPPAEQLEAAERVLKGFDVQGATGR